LGDIPAIRANGKWERSRSILAPFHALLQTNTTLAREALFVLYNTAIFSFVQDSDTIIVLRKLPATLPDPVRNLRSFPERIGSTNFSYIRSLAVNYACTEMLEVLRIILSSLQEGKLPCLDLVVIKIASQLGGRRKELQSLLLTLRAGFKEKGVTAVFVEPEKSKLRRDERKMKELLSGVNQALRDMELKGK
jgi:hypothetical protein